MNTAVTSFDANAPKYHTICCGAHIRTLASVFIIIDLVLTIITGSFIFLIPILIVGIGLYGVFHPSRACLLIYIGINLIGIFISITLTLVGMVAEESIRRALQRQFDIKIENSGSAKLITILSLAYIAIRIAITYTYCRLANFVKDLENSQRIHIVYEKA